MTQTTNLGVLFQDQGLHFLPLSPHHRDATCMIVARAFLTEPTMLALEKAGGSKAKLADWVDFVDFWMGDACGTGLSVIAIDPELHTVAGAFLVRDLQYVAPGFFEDKYQQGSVFYDLLACLDELDKAAYATTDIMKKAGPGEVADFWMLAVAPNYRGRKLANNLFKAARQTVEATGFKYGVSECTGAFSTKGAENVGFQCVTPFDAKVMLRKKYATLEFPDPHTGLWNYMMCDLSKEAKQETAAENEK